MTPIIGFAPDKDSTVPGVLTDCSMVYPTPAGYKAAPSAVTCGLPALGSACQGATIARKIDNSKRIFAGTQTRMYQQSGATWADVSRAGNYTGGADTRWRFAQFGDVSLACNSTEILQASSSGAFADVATSPKSKLIDIASGFVMLAGTNEGTYGDQADRWWCSGLYDHTIWTPAISTQCVTGRLIDSPGDIRALRRLGADIIAYKERSIYIGRYVGAPIVWSWTQVSGDIGTPSNEAVVNIGTAHIFVGYEDIYLFDGTRPQAIGKDVKQWFFRDVNPSYRNKIIGTQDRAKSLVMFYYPSVASSTGAIDSCLIYHWTTGKWSRANRAIEAAVEYTAAGISYDSLGTSYGTWDSLPSISYDSPFWTAESIVPSVFDTTHTLVQIAGNAGASSITTGDMGDDSAFTTISRVVPRFLSAPTSATLSNTYRNIIGEASVAGISVALANGRFDYLQSARWHRATIAAQGDMEITGYDVQAVKTGAF